MNRLTPCLWFDGAAEAATAFYAGLFPDTRVVRAPRDYPAGKAGDGLTVEFTLLGHPALALYGGPGHSSADALSFQVHPDTQEETDRYGEALVADDGAPGACWCLSGQVIARHSDPAAAARLTTAMMGTAKIDIAALDRAVAGAPA